MKKERLDILLVQKGFFSSREKARRFIMTGNVLVNDIPVDKPGTQIDNSAEIRLRGKPLRYVGRGGLKLEHAIREFKIDFTNKVMIDIGASTGGFTDCALQHGASKVYAIDVGYGQLDWKLRSSEQVINFERTNIRYVTPDMIGEMADIISIDVSFISLVKVLPPTMALLKNDGDLIALIKPQFEAGRNFVGKGGIVRNSQTHQRVLHKVIEEASEIGLYVYGLSVSPIRGADGNIEFLVWLKKIPSDLNYKEIEKHIQRVTDTTEKRRIK